MCKQGNFEFAGELDVKVKNMRPKVQGGRIHREVRQRAGELNQFRQLTGSPLELGYLLLR